jgi:AcrR family transcriptional regulator
MSTPSPRRVSNAPAERRKGAVTPNRRGIRSREAALDAAEALMAERGFDAATIASLEREAGLQASSIYHYFGSKDGVLLAVMERGAQRFFAELPRPTHRIGRPAEHLEAMTSVLIDVLGRHPDFLRLLVVFAAQPSTAGGGEVRTVVNRVRATALEFLREQLALAYGDDPHDPVTEQLARFALAAIDGAFVAHQADPQVKLEEVLLPFAASATAIRRTLREG